MIIDLAIWIATSLLLFAVGIYGLATKDNGLKMVFALEILVCATSFVWIGLGFVDTITRFDHESYVLISLGIGGAIIGIALAMLSNIAKKTGTASLSEVTLKW